MTAEVVRTGGGCSGECNGLASPGPCGACAVLPCEDHEPSDYALNMNAAEGRPLWCDWCGVTIEYAGSDAAGRPTFREVAA